MSYNPLSVIFPLFCGTAIGVVGCVATTAYVGGQYASGKNVFHTFPRDRNVAEGYVKPSEIEVILDDLDHDGKNETLFSLKDKNYLLVTDKSGRPTIMEYSLSKARISYDNGENSGTNQQNNRQGESVR